MKIEYRKEFSPALGREMEMSIYGHAGRPVLYIPCQDGHHYDFENFHMTDTWSEWIESGQIMVFSIDTIDLETYSNTEMDPRSRIERHEQWFAYITDEVVPYIYETIPAKAKIDGTDGIIAFGCSLGATHAANLYLRRPDLFDGLLALSGIFSSGFGFGSYSDDLVYANSPVDYMANFPEDHPYMDLFKDRTAVICCGTGPWEMPDSTFRLKEIFEQKNIPIWVDIWGYDVAHDWDWWYKQVAYFVPYLLNKNTKNEGDI